ARKELSSFKRNVGHYVYAPSWIYTSAVLFIRLSYVDRILENYRKDKYEPSLKQSVQVYVVNISRALYAQQYAVDCVNVSCKFEIVSKASNILNRVTWLHNELMPFIYKLDEQSFDIDIYLNAYYPIDRDMKKNKIYNPSSVVIKSEIDAS